MNKSKISIISIFVIFLLHFIAFLLIKNHDLIVDEYYHYDQIVRFINYDYRLNGVLMTLPGYHFFIASIAQLFDKTDVAFIRLISLFLNLLSIPVFYAVASMIDKKNACPKTIQYSFFPIIFPFFPLIYTDIFSTFLILLSLYFLLKKHFLFSGLFSLASVVVRQNNIFWLVFLSLLIYMQEFGFSLKIAYLKTYFHRTWTFYLGALLLGLFIFFNHGLVLSDYAKSYVRVSFSNLGNVYFCLFLFFFLFLPGNISRLKDIFQALLKRKVFLSVLALFLFFMFTFVNDHPFNAAPWFLHNNLLIFFTRNNLQKAIFFIPVAYSLLAIATTKLYKKPFYLLYPVAFIYLLPYWLVEQRYYMVLYVLFLLFRRKESLRVEYSTIIIYLILSAVLFIGVLQGRFFL